MFVLGYLLGALHVAVMAWWIHRELRRDYGLLRDDERRYFGLWLESIDPEHQVSESFLDRLRQAGMDEEHIAIVRGPVDNEST